MLWRIGKMNYDIETPGGRKDKKTFHVNMLKQWKPPEENFVNIISDEKEEIPYSTEEQQSLKEYGEKNLIERQQKQMEDLLHQYSLITGNRHGSTTNVKHQIITTNQQPIRQCPYHIPSALKKDVVIELNELLKTGVVETSTRDWASPIIVIKKNIVVTKSALITTS